MPPDQESKFLAELRVRVIRATCNERSRTRAELSHASRLRAEMFRLDVDDDTPRGWTSLANSLAISWQMRSWLVNRLEYKRTMRVSFESPMSFSCAR